MQKIYICQILDLLAKKVMHTYMAASHEHAVRQFKDFLKSLEGKIHNDDFAMCVVGYVDVFDSFDEAYNSPIFDSGDSYRGDEVMSYES